MYVYTIYRLHIACAYILHMFIDRWSVCVIAFSYRILRTFIGGEGAVRRQRKKIVC